MTIDMIIEKRKHYSEMLNALENKNISEEVELRLQSERDRITAEVVGEIETDKLKCKDYIFILDELLTSIPQTESVEETDNKVELETAESENI